MGHDVIDSQQRAFKDYKSEQAAQRAKERDSKHQNDDCAENVRDDLPASIDPVVVLREVSQGDLPISGSRYSR